MLALVALAAAVWWGVWLAQRQVLPGRLVDYHNTHGGLWEVACDSAMDGSDRGCYLQYVDVYRPRPDFAAAMVEVVVHEGGDGWPDPHVRFDIEPGLSFADATLEVETPEGTRPLDVSGCESNTCQFTGEAGRAVLQFWRQGGALHIRIDEGRDGSVNRVWRLDRMDTILDDFAKQRRARQLP